MSEAMICDGEVGISGWTGRGSEFLEQLTLILLLSARDGTDALLPTQQHCLFLTLTQTLTLIRC